MLKDTFQFTMPAEIIKSGDEYKIGGLASTSGLDQQGESLIQKGIDLTPVDEGKGFFNFDHSNTPEDTLGLIDGYKKDEKGLYVYGRLFKGHKRAEAVYSIMKAMQDSGTGSVGLSVEGKILERDPLNPKIIKRCRIKNIAITFNPVNKDTYASLMKSMSGADIEWEATKDQKSEAKSVDPIFSAGQVMELVQKALGVGDSYAKEAPGNLTGGDALAQESLDKKKKKATEEGPSIELNAKPKKLKKMTKDMYKSNMMDLLNNIQGLYPNNTRSEIWEAVKDRLNKKFPNIKAIFEAQS